jgi:hypothetical protein
MTDNRSLLQRFTSAAGQVGAILSQVDLDMLDRSQIKLIGTIKHLLADARLDIRDWEMSDSREEMQRNAHEAVKRIDQARASILLASEHDLFTAINVADITSQFDYIESELRK